MNLVEVKQFLDENKDNAEVKQFLATLSKPNVNSVKAFLEEDAEGKKLLKSLTDQRVTQGIETFKANNLDKLVQARFNELYPPETPAEKRLREIEAKLRESEQAAKLEKLKSVGLRQLTDKGLSADLLDLIQLGETEEQVSETINKLSTLIETVVKTKVGEKFKELGRKPKEGEVEVLSRYKGKNPFKKESWNLTEQGRLFKYDRDLYQALKDEANV